MRKSVVSIGVLVCAAAAVLAAVAFGQRGAGFAGSKEVTGRAYVANEATGTVSVIDTDRDTIVGTICLGSDPAIPGTPQPAGPCNAERDHHQPLYNGHVDPHGLWLTPDASVLLVANRISGTIVAIATGTNAPLGYLPVGREPHLATVAPSGSEAWAAIRGENYVEVLKLDRDDLFDASRLRTERIESVVKVPTVRGPSMVSFSPDGQHAFVAAAKQARVDKIDTATREVVATRAVAAPFTPFGLVTPDGRELYLVHKAAGTLSVLRTSDLGPVVENLPIGTRPNHVAFVGPYAYVTVAGPPGGSGKVVIFDRASHSVVREFSGPDFAGEPHGIWPTGNGKLYVGHETGNRVGIIRTGDPDDAADDAFAGSVGGSAADLAFLRKPIDVVATGY
jgi:DNA-binding beta-propeller fold protein YncE